MGAVCDDTSPDQEATMPIDFDDYLELPDAAAYIHRSSRTVRRWVFQGLLPGTLRLRQQLLVPRDALDALLEPAGPPPDEDDAGAAI